VAAVSGDYSVGQVTGAAVDAEVVHLAGAETVSGAKTFSSNTSMSSVSVSGNLVLPQGSGFVPAVGGIGLDTAAGLPVVNMADGGAGCADEFQHQRAGGDGSGAGGDSDAVQRVVRDGDCGERNANCSVPDVIQLAETTAPAGIPNWGVFWFDSTYHAPFFIDNDGQAVQLGLRTCLTRILGAM